MSEYVKALEAERDHYSAQVGALKAELAETRLAVDVNNSGWIRAEAEIERLRKFLMDINNPQASYAERSAAMDFVSNLREEDGDE